MPRYESYGQLDSAPVEELEVGFKGYNNFLRPDQLPAGVLAESLNGRIDINGEWTPRKGISVELSPFTTPDFVLPFYAYANENVSAIAGPTAGEITLTIAGHSFNDQTLASVSNMDQSSYNGNFIITVVDGNNIKYTVTDVGAASTSGTVVVGAPKIDASATAIRGAESWYDDSADNEAYIIIAGNSEATAYKISDGTTTTINYPASLTIDSDCVMRQFQNKVFIFLDGSTALEWDGDLSGSPAFTRVANGAYSGVGLLSTASNTTIADGLATVSETSHGLSTGDVVSIVDAGTTDLIEGQTYEITKINDNSFSFYENVDDATSVTVKYLPEQSQSLGYTHQPAFPWAEVHQSRLVGPYNYTMAGSSGASPTIADREVRDEIIFSRKFDTDIYDHIYGQFKFSPGKSDYVVALHSFSDDQLVVLNRESIYVISNSQDIKQANVQLLTADLGCVARESVARVGDKIVFLADNGVYALSFVDLYNLRGQDVPLSKAINPDIQRINWDYAKDAEAVYFDNRYYIAVPIDGSSVNNALFVYNFLNNEWESIDSINDPSWRYKRLMVAGDESSRAVYTVNASGGIHKIDGSPDGQDRFISAAGATLQTIPVMGSCTTRSVTGGTVDRKKWKTWDLHIESDPDFQSDCDLSAIFENLDSVKDLGKLSDYNGGVLDIAESGTFRGRFGRQRSYGTQFKIETTQGRPKIRAVKFTAHGTMGSTTKAT